jgi:hypothetical protein
VPPPAGDKDDHASSLDDLERLLIRREVRVDFEVPQQRRGRIHVGGRFGRRGAIGFVIHAHACEVHDPQRETWGKKKLGKKPVRNFALQKFEETKQKKTKIYLEE